MKKATLLTAASLLIIMAIALMSAGSEKADAVNTEITGTWRLDTYHYGEGATSFTSVSSTRPRIKLITENSFMWVSYDSSSKKIVSSAGGRYTLKGDAYSESIDFGTSMDSYLGTVSNFRIKVADRMLYLSGYLNNGLKIEEVWRKVE